MKHMEYDPANPAHAVIVDVMRQAVETFPQWSDKPPLDMPLNMRTGKVYSGVNRVLLYLTACIRGIGDMRFCTKRQVEYLGGELLHSAEPFVSFQWNRTRERSLSSAALRMQDLRSRLSRVTCLI